MKNKKRVLIISPGYYPITGGKGGAIEGLLDLYLADNGRKQLYEIVVYAGYTKELVKDEDVYEGVIFRSINLDSLKYRIGSKLHRAIKRILGDTYRRQYFHLVVRDLIRRKEQDCYDTIIIENSLDEILYFRKKIKTKTPVVLHLHNDLLSSDVKDARRIYAAIDECWVNSKFILGRVNNINPSVRKTKVLYNTTPMYEFLDVDDAGPVKDDFFTVLYTGRIMPEKGVYELVLAFNEFNKRHPKTKMVIAGGGKSLYKEDPYIEKIRNSVIDNKAITFLGNSNRRALADLYWAADVQVVPSKGNEAFGLTALEGMIFGVPVIFSDRGGLPEIFDDHSLMLQKTTPEAIFDKLEFVYQNRDQAKKTALANLQNTGKFSIESYCRTFEKYIGEVARK